MLKRLKPIDRDIIRGCLFAASVLFVLAILGLLYIRSIFNDVPLATPFDREWVDSRGGINLLMKNAIPHDATAIVYSGYSIMQAASAQARFKIPAGKLPELLNGLGFTEPLEQGLCPFRQLCENSLDWWRPQDAQVYAGGQVYSGLAAAGTEYNVMVDMTDSETHIIYVLMYFD